MNDKELRGIVLKHLYDRRREGQRQFTADDIESMGVEFSEVLRAVEQLEQNGLVIANILHAGTKGGLVPIDAAAKISAFGCDVIEGTTQSPISISMNFTNHFAGPANVQQGSHNTMNIDASVKTIIEAINQSPATDEQKKEAKDSLAKTLSLEAFKAAVGAGTKALLGL